MKILLHACCGPCACYPTVKLTEDKIDFDIFWYNPNIHPYTEYKKRLAALRDFCTKCNYNLFIDKDYSLEKMIGAMLAEEECRCRACYRVRLHRIAEYAAKHNYDAFSTTLLVSPYQKHDFIKEIAEQAGKAFGVKFYYDDWRIGYETGVQRSLDLGLYRQQYCGCVFSERDRYQPSGNRCQVLDNAQEQIERVTKNIAIVRSFREISNW